MQSQKTGKTRLKTGMTTLGPPHFLTCCRPPLACYILKFLCLLSPTLVCRYLRFQPLHKTMSSRAETMPCAFLNAKHLAQFSHSIQEERRRTPPREALFWVICNHPSTDTKSAHRCKISKVNNRVRAPKKTFMAESLNLQLLSCAPIPNFDWFSP